MKWGLLLLILSSSLHAQILCDVNAGQATKVIPLKRKPNYFFKISPDGRWVYYIADGANWALNTVTGQEIPLPGAADPVPSADGKVLTYIKRAPTGGWLMSAQSMNPPWIPPTSDVPVSTILTHGSYQSVTAQRPDGTRSVFYYDEENDNLNFHNLEPSGSGYVFAPGNSRFRVPNLRLPMLSPDGKRFSAFDTTLQKTVIFEIQSDGSAKRTHVLPVGGGKATFSQDGSKITFHLTRQMIPGSRNNEKNYPAILGSDGVLRNVYTYDLKTKKIEQITNNVGDDSWYPVFTQGNRIAYINRSNDDKFSIVIADPPSKVQTNTVEEIVACFGAGGESKLADLANAWARACKLWPTDYKFFDSGIGLIMATSIPDSTCRELAKNDADKDMIRLCDVLASTHDTHPSLPPVVNPTPVEDLPRQAWQNNCAMCHEGEEKERVSSPQLEALLEGKGKGRRKSMPPSKVLSSEEQKLIKTYLEQFKKL